MERNQKRSTESRDARQLCAIENPRCNRPRQPHADGHAIGADARNANPCDPAEAIDFDLMQQSRAIRKQLPSRHPSAAIGQPTGIRLHGSSDFRGRWTHTTGREFDCLIDADHVAASALEHSRSRLNNACRPVRPKHRSAAF